MRADWVREVVSFPVLAEVAAEITPAVNVPTWVMFACTAAGKEPAKELASSKYGAINAAHWSPDGKYVVYAKTDVTRSTDIYLLPVAGGAAQASAIRRSVRRRRRRCC